MLLSTSQFDRAAESWRWRDGCRYDIGITGGVTAMPAFQQRFFPDVYRQTHDSSGAVSMYCQARHHMCHP